MLAAESRGALLAALARLRPDDRLVLGCRYLLELTEAETAAALGVPAGHRQVAHVARARAPARGGDAMTDLERALRELDVDWPATPDLADRGARADRGRARAPARPRAARSARAVPARAAAQSRVGAGWRARLAYLAAALVLLGGGTLAASPDARSTVLRWLGLEERGDPARAAAARRAASRSADAGPRRADRARAARATGAGARPAALGDPDAVYADDAARRHDAPSRSSTPARGLPLE